MADVQKQFIQFDEAIRLKRFDEEATLREKREAVLGRLRDRLGAMRRDNRKIPTFEPFNQGSYQMGTGVRPAEGDFDIDVGLRFQRTRPDYANPLDLKTLVFDALSGHTREVKMRRSCVTVFYQAAGERVYHVDLAVYAQEARFLGEPDLFIAKGKLNSDERNRAWEPSDPQGFMRWVEQHYQGDEQRQFLRVIRMLKRWKTEKFKNDGNNAPSGIALTVVAGTWFRPQFRGWLSNTSGPDDLDALVRLVDATLVAFSHRGVGANGAAQYRLAAKLPVTPRCDLFERMTDGQMTTLRDRLQALKSTLQAVRTDTDVFSACRRLRSEFGEEFPTS